MDRTSLYHEDIYAWAEQQAAALRRIAATRTDLPNELDLDHIAEEIGDLGKSELRATTSPLTQALAHLRKLAADRNSLAAAHWSGEVSRFLLDAQAAYSPSMRRLIDLDKLWRDALRLAYANLRSYGVETIPDVPATCPFSLDELLDRDFDMEAAVSRLRAPSV